MMPLGLTRAQLRLYHDRLFSNHDFRVEVEVLHMDESVRGALDGEFIDGQVNLQANDGGVSRTATFSLYDPNHALHLDPDSPFDMAVYFNRMIRVKHIIDVPGIPRPVRAVPFVGPITKISREGSVLTVEAQDKAVLAIEGRPPMKRKKGHNAVDAIKDFMRAAGERRFRFEVPEARRKRRLPKAYSIGWTTEASPWAVCQQIARGVLGLQLVYACDGALLLRPLPGSPEVWHHLTDTTGQVKVDYDASTVRNHVRVQGQIPAKPKKKIKAKKFTETATARKGHPMAPASLGRNGSHRYLPLLVADNSIKTHKDARQRAARDLAANLPLQVAAAWSGLPFFHLDTGDQIGVTTPDGTFRTPLREASLPLGLGGNASVGAQRRVSKARKTGKRAAK